jgi:hypothetical protein
MRFHEKIGEHSLRKREKRKATRTVTASVVIESVPVLVNPKKWWLEYKRENVLFLDTEMVSLAIERLPEEKQKYRQVVATVAICDSYGNEVLNETVFHSPGSFLVNKYTKKINGFNKYSLINGKNIEIVRQSVHDILFAEPEEEPKLIILWDATPDFNALRLEAGVYDVFDLQKHYDRYATHDIYHEFPLKTKLKAVYNKLFPGEPFQDGVHDAMSDALATRRIFMEGYIKKDKIFDLNLRENFDPYGEHDFD